MARALARKKTATEKPGKVVSSTIKAGANQKLKPSRAGSPVKKSPGKPKKSPMKTVKRAKESKHRSTEENAGAVVERKRTDYGMPTPPPDKPPPLLRDSRSTAAALALLEKGIKLIYQKDFKKARQELKSLLDSHPGESEILARARSYIQICDREEAAHRKPNITNDQLYSLGVLDHNRGNYEGAVAYFRQSLELHPKADYIYYSLAASLAMKGETAEAIRSLRNAIALNEDNRVYAKNDTDFVPLHALKEFAELVGLSQSTVNNSTVP
jgi:tetratricopeptide (TPR) repeat protein